MVDGTGSLGQLADFGFGAIPLKSQQHQCRRRRYRLRRLAEDHLVAVIGTSLIEGSIQEEPDSLQDAGRVAFAGQPEAQYKPTMPV